MKKATEKDLLYVATFDMESVLLTLYHPTGQTFYKRKLSVYNLSVFSSTDKSAACYIWTAVEAESLDSTPKS